MEIKKSNFAWSNFNIAFRDKDFQQMVATLISNSNRILDVGCGIGDYLKYTNPNQIVTAVEPHLPYMQKAKDQAEWANILNTDALSFFENCAQKFDLILLIDVVEHLDEEDAYKLIDEAKNHCDGVVFAQIPIGVHAQSEDVWNLGGEYWQEHRCTWDEKKLIKAEFTFFQIWENWYKWAEKDDRTSVALWTNYPLVSVVVPSYNQADWLPKTLESIIEQSYPVWEAIVVDDGSTDNTWEVIKEYSKNDSRIKGFRKTNGGISSALNAGIDKASGKYFCWLSSDDLFNPSKLELQVKAFEQLDNSYGIIFGSFDLIDAKDKITQLTQSKPFFDKMEFPQQLKYDMIDGCTVIMPMSVMREMGGFNTQYKHAQDTEFWFRLAAKGYKFKYISEKFTKRRIHEQQGFTDFNLDCRYDGYYFVNFYLSNYSFRDFYKKLNFSNDDDLNKFIGHFYEMIADFNCHINHSVINDKFLSWFETGLKTIEVKKRKIIIQGLIQLFTAQKNEDQFNKNYILYLKRLLKRIGNTKQAKHNLRKDFADITKYDRTKDNLFADKLLKFGLSELKNKRYDIAMSVFKYLSDFQNIYYEDAVEKFYDLVLQLNEHSRFIKSFRRKKHILTFPDQIKLYYLFSKYMLAQNDDELENLYNSIKDENIKRNFKRIKSELSSRITKEQILFWDYTVIPYEVQHYIEFQCSNCNNKVKRKIISQLNNTPQKEMVLCKSCFTLNEFDESILNDYFKSKIQKSSPSSVINNRRPRVSFVMRYTNIIGGGVKIAYKYMQRLNDLGCAVTVYTDTDEPSWVTLPVKFIRVNDHYEIEKIDADAVVIFSIYDVPKILMKYNPERVFHLCQGYEGYHIGRNYNELRSDKFFYTALHSLPVQNILVSNHLMKMFEEKWNRKGHYIPNGIDLSIFHPIKLKALKKNSILFVGNPYDKLKGFQFLIESLAGLQKSNLMFDELNLIIVWGGAKLNGEEMFKESNGLKVHFLSGLTSSEISELMNEVNLVVSTSWYEGFSLPILEAMACGIPTIVTNNMGAESFCVHNVNSFIVKNNDHESLMNYISDVLRNRLDLISIIKNGFKTALEYSEYNSFKAFVKTWQEILQVKFDDYCVDKLIGDTKVENLDLWELYYKKQNEIPINYKENSTPIVSVVVPTYNQLKYSIEFLLSFKEKTKLEYEVIVIDNASIASTIDSIQKGFPFVSLIQNNENLGFPCAVNQGIQTAKGKYILIANNDIVVTEGWLERLIEVAESDKRIGIVGPISNEVSGVQKDKDAYYKTIDEMHLYAAAVKQKNNNTVMQFPRVAFLCTLIKREVIEKIGGLDERFSPGNYEDDDFCLRAQLAGYKTVIAQDVFIHHYGSKSFKADGEKKYAERLKINHQIFVDKWGADPDEIWLKQKPFNHSRSLFISIDKDEFIKAFEHAQNNINDKEFDLALSELGLAIEKYNSSDKAYSIISKEDLLLLSANVSLIIKDLEKANKFFEEALKLNPSSSEACFGLGQVFYQTEMYEQSKAMFEWAIKNNFKNANALEALKSVNEILAFPSEHNSLFEVEVQTIEAEK